MYAIWCGQKKICAKLLPHYLNMSDLHDFAAAVMKMCFIAKALQGTRAKTDPKIVEPKWYIIRIIVIRIVLILFIFFYLITGGS